MSSDDQVDYGVQAAGRKALVIKFGGLITLSFFLLGGKSWSIAGFVFDDRSRRLHRLQG